MHIRRSVFVKVLAFPVALALVVLGPMLTAARGQDDMAPELSPNLGWLNTDRPLRFSDELKGHVVVLDFWTYCCINCIHILPDLEYLEHKYADEPVVVVGVHSAKFHNEADRESIRNAVFRYNIRHPVVIDDNFGIWKRYGTRSWPTFVVVDTRGRIIGAASGEGNRDVLDNAIAKALERGRADGSLAAVAFKPKLDAVVASATGLSFPGKVLAVAPESGAAGYLFISDSSHHRVLVASYPDEAGRASLLGALGTGEAGLVDGAATAARFHDPQGMAFDGASRTLYVADTKNHAIRAVAMVGDASQWAVRTIVGTGKQSYDRRGGLAGREQGISSPWDVALSRDGTRLYIAMAGPHQLWQTELSTGVTGVLAGSGREDIADGAASAAALAQPSGLALSPDGKKLYFADSETSAIRVLDLEAGRVSTLIGTGLFDFGDIDGTYPRARLQHPLGVAILPGGDPGAYGLVVADTYNHRLKVIDPEKKSAARWLGSTAGDADYSAPGALHLNEPAGVSVAGSGIGMRVFVADTNNHRIVVVDSATRSWREVSVSGVAAPGRSVGVMPEGVRAVTVTTPPRSPLTLLLEPGLEKGYHPNPEAPAAVVVRVVDGEGVPGEVIVQRTVRVSGLPIEVTIPPTAVGAGVRLLVEVSFAVCTDDASVCVPASGSWVVTLREGELSGATLTGG